MVPHLARLLTFCDLFEDKVLARDPGARVELKSIPQRRGVYVVLVESSRGEQEAYEITWGGYNNWSWIKVYGPQG